MKISTVAKFIDQPIILNKLQRRMPAVLVATGASVGICDTFRHKTDRKKHGVKNAIIIGSTIAATLVGTRGLKVNGKKIFNGLMETEPLKDLLARQSAAVDKYISNANIKDNTLLKILTKPKTTHLSVKDIDLLSVKLPQNQAREDLFGVILPDVKGECETFSEIKRLSLLGAIPVVGGVAGGIVADKVTGHSSRKRTANKIKEGFYQYFANIFLCNVGAGAAMFTANQLQKHKIIKPLTRAQKLVTILSGITATGIVGGSYIANYLSKKIINPMFKQKNQSKLYAERKPEALDIALHADDIATAGILSGFKWIEPALPLMYFVSGYRAGIGYRNGNSGKHTTMPHTINNNISS